MSRALKTNPKWNRKIQIFNFHNIFALIWGRSFSREDVKQEENN